MTGAGSLLELTGDNLLGPLRVGMVTRFPPSCSGAAQAHPIWPRRWSAVLGSTSR